VFAVQGWFIAGVIPLSHEELSVHPAPPSSELTIEDGVGRTVDMCAGPSRLVFTQGRPSLVLCAGGLAWPIMVMEYIGGVLYWPLQLLRPLHHGDPIALRRTALAVGIVTLGALFLLVERLGDSRRAAATVLVAAVLPLFVILHSLLILFETVPPLLIICAALIVARRPDPSAPPAPARAAAAAALVGLAVLGNVKAAVLVIPLLAFSLFESPGLRRTSARAWYAAGVAAALAVSPMVIAALADPQHRFRHQVITRVVDASARLDPRLLALEFFYLPTMTVDPRYFLDGGLWPATLLVPAAALAYSVRALIRAVRHLPHDRIAAACGALQLFYIVFVWLAYGQSIHANYGPLACAQAVSIGCAIAAVGRWMVQRGHSPLLGFAAVGAITLASVVPNTYRRGNPRDLEISNNLNAERALGEHLRYTPGGPVAVTSYNLAGIPDALTGNSALRLDVALASCQQQVDTETCERGVFVAAIEAVPAARFLVPLRTTPMDEPPVRRVMTTIEDAARVLGARLREEARFETSRGVPVLALFVVDRHPPDARVRAHNASVIAAAAAERLARD